MHIVKPEKKAGLTIFSLKTNNSMTTKEAYRLLEPAHFLEDKDLVQPITPNDIETRRRIIDFIHEIDTARFMLAMSYKHPYTDLVDEKDYDNKFKTEYFKQHYLYSALIWYHNSFDLVLQCLWFKYHLYKEDQICADNIDKILYDCKISKIEERLYNNKSNNPITEFNDRNKDIHNMANRLKHRQYIENDNYLLYAEAFNVVSEGYDSNVTRFRKKLSEIQSELVDYHKDIIQLSKDLLVPIHKSISNVFCE